MDDLPSTGKMYGWKKLFQSVLGWNPDMEFLPALPAALVLYVSIFVFGQILYNMTKLIVPKQIRGYVLDFVKTMTLCAYPFGHGIMRQNYGEPGYLLSMIPLITVTIMAFPDGDGNPIGVWLKYYRGVIPLWKSVFKNLIQISAGFAAYHLGMYILGLELHPFYVDRLKDYYNSFCTTNLNVPMHVGFALEFCAVVYETWFSSHMFFSNPVLDTMLKTLNVGIIVTLGVHLTGMFMHPAMATGLTWGCGDTDRSAHILIYWVGPMLGAWLSVQIHKRFSLKFNKKPTKPTRKKLSGKEVAPNGFDKAANVDQSNGHQKRRSASKKQRFYN